MDLPQHQLAKARDDLTWLAAHGALTGVAAIIAERRAAVERGDEPPTAYAAYTEVDLGNYAKAAALIAAEIDQEGQVLETEDSGNGPSSAKDLCMRAYNAATDAQLANRRTRWVMDLSHYKQIRAEVEAISGQHTDPDTWIPTPDDRMFALPIVVRDDGGEPHLETPDEP